MRGLTVFLVLAGVALAAANIPVCPAPVEGGDAILFPNLDDCTTFWECAGYEPIFMHCPEDLWFNPHLSVCDYPENIGDGVCTPPNGVTTEGTTAEPTAETTEETTAEPTAEPTEETTAEPTEEPTEETTAEPTAESTEETTAKPTEETTAEPTAESTEETTAEPTEETTVETTAEPTEETTAKPTESPEGQTEESILLKKLMKRNNHF